MIAIGSAVRSGCGYQQDIQPALAPPSFGDHAIINDSTLQQRGNGARKNVPVVAKIAPACYTTTRVDATRRDEKAHPPARKELTMKRTLRWVLVLSVAVFAHAQIDPQIPTQVSPPVSADPLEEARKAQEMRNIQTPIQVEERRRIRNRNLDWSMV